MEDHTFISVTLILLKALLKLLFLHSFHKYLCLWTATLSGPGNKIVRKAETVLPLTEQRRQYGHKTKNMKLQMWQCWKERHVSNWRRCVVVKGSSENMMLKVRSVGWGGVAMVTWRGNTEETACAKALWRMEQEGDIGREGQTICGLAGLVKEFWICPESQKTLDGINDQFCI